jgi:hypothetical protein
MRQATRRSARPCQFGAPIILTAFNYANANVYQGNRISE